MKDNQLSDDSFPFDLHSLNREVQDKKINKKVKNVKIYDFKKALRFSQDQIRTITRIHENYARLLTSFFTAELRTFVQISITSVDQCSYDEFISKVKRPSILGVFKAPPLKGDMLMEFPGDLSFVILERLLGGQGKGNSRCENLELTEIEISVMQRVIIKALTSFQEAWASIIKLSPELREIEVNPQFLTLSPPNETIVLVTMNMKVGEYDGFFRICLPHVALEQELPKLSARHLLANQKNKVDSYEAKVIEKKLQNTKIDVRAILGKTTLEIGDFLKLSAGDMIRLNEFYSDPLTILVDNKPKFLAQPGLSKGRIAVQVTHVYREGEKNDNN